MILKWVILHNEYYECRKFTCNSIFTVVLLFLLK